MGHIAIFIIDPHEVCRSAFAAAITRHADGMTIAGTAADVGQAERSSAVTSADAIVLAAQQPDERHAIRLLRTIAPRAAITVVSPWTDGESVVIALREGARGYMPEWAEPDVVVDAIAATMNGTLAVHPDLATGALDRALVHIDGVATPEPLTRLTDRERRVLDLLEDGLSPAEIAARLFLSKRTVQSHLQGAYGKLGVHGRVEAMWEYRRLRRHVGENVS